MVGSTPALSLGFRVWGLLEHQQATLAIKSDPPGILKRDADHPPVIRRSYNTFLQKNAHRYFFFIKAWIQIIDGLRPQPCYDQICQQRPSLLGPDRPFAHSNIKLKCAGANIEKSLDYVVCDLAPRFPFEDPTLSA